MCVEEGVIIVSSDKMGGHIRAPDRQLLRLKATGSALSSSTGDGKPEYGAFVLWLAIIIFR